MYFPMSGGGGAKPEEIGIKYDEANDVVQLYYNGQWVDWKSGGMSYPIGTEINFGYTGDVQKFTVPATGFWKLEVWGARGMSWGSTNGGYGGYCYGNVELEADQLLDVVVGAQNRYNGGGTGGSSYNAHGGGCTHIAKTTLGSPYNTLSSYSDEANAMNYVLIVAGGGGGAWDSNTGGVGGGLTGGNGGGSANANPGTGGSQSAAGTSAGGGTGGFGYGGNGTRTAGGGGWYGGGGSTGGSGDGTAGSGGGSSWYGGCISGTTGTTAGQNTGNGKAKLTYLGRVVA